MRCTPNYESDHTKLLHSLWGILCATFGEKMTESRQVTELSRHKRNVRPFFREMADWKAISTDHDEASFYYFRSHYILFGSTKPAQWCLSRLLSQFDWKELAKNADDPMTPLTSSVTSHKVKKNILGNCSLSQHVILTEITVLQFRL